MLLALSFIAFCAFVALAVALPLTGSRTVGIASLASLALFVGMRLGAFVLAGRLHCGLCHGTIMSEKACRKHVEAVRIKPLSYLATTVLSVLFTFSFRCMYCGTRFRLWK